MANLPKLNDPWLVAVWPGMGHVSLSAGYYLMSKLQMHSIAELSARELFEFRHVEVNDGLLRLGRLPRNRFFLWRDPAERRDIVVFIGEAQPPLGTYQFCAHLIEFAQQLGVQRVFTFAAMATHMHPEHTARVFAAASDADILGELRQHDVEVLKEGQISGLNGVLPGVAAEKGLTGACLLGEMPHIFAQFPFPKASLAVLQAFAQIADLDLDMTELSEQADAMNEQLGDLLARIEEQFEDVALSTDDDEGYDVGQPEEPRLSQEDEQLIERLFHEAEENRTKAYELKRELDRLEVFADYEDRFLDLFKKPDA